MNKFIFSAFADESDNNLSGQIWALKRNGYKYLEIRAVDGENFTDLTAEKAIEKAKLLKNSGIEVWSLGSPIGKVDINCDFNKYLELYRHTLELGNIFETEHIRLFSFFPPKGENPNDYTEQVIEKMAVMTEIAKEFGIIPCHENEKGIYGDTAERCLKLHKAIPDLKAVFDPANFVQCGQDTLNAWNMLSPYVEYMHVKDAVGAKVVPAGMGDGNVLELLRMYKKQGGKVITIEPHLFDFVGLKSLEQEGDESAVGEMSFKTSEEAFDYAVKTLYGLVDRL